MRQQIKEHIRNLIKKEGLKPGDKILSQNQLASLFKVTPLTIVRALAELCDEGVIYRENGRGTFAGPAPNSKKMRNVCMVLPEEDLELPERNPLCWMHVQQWFKSFLDCTKYDMSFSSIAIPHSPQIKESLEKIKSFDAVFFITPAGYKDLAKAMIAEDISCPVLLGGNDSVNCLKVRFDLKGNAKLSAAHLASLGYKKIGLFCSSDYWEDSFISTFQKAITEFGIPFDKNSVFRGFASHEDGANAAGVCLSRSMPFDAIICSSTRVALGMIEEFRRKGVKIPEEIGIMTIEGVEFLVKQPPYLTCALAPVTECISFALSKLLEANWKFKENLEKEFTGEIYPGKTCRELK